MVLPNSKNRINESFTYEEVFAYLIQAVGFIFMLGGALITANKRMIGGVVCLVAITFLLATQDNPMLIEHIKPKPKSKTIRFDDLARHLSLIGAILYMMFVPPVVDEEPEEDKKGKKKKNKVE